MVTPWQSPHGRRARRCGGRALPALADGREATLLSYQGVHGGHVSGTLGEAWVVGSGWLVTVMVGWFNG